MRLAWFTLSLLFVAAFSLAGWLEPWFQGWAGSRTRSANLLQVALGDGRKLFARHFFAKADAYFHSGFYPSFFEERPNCVHRPSSGSIFASASPHQAGHDHDEEHAPGPGRPRDWLERFGRHFQPYQHRHLGESPKAAGEEREMLPWLRLAASLDAEMPETYLVTAYWLRSRLGRVNEAEQFLREGLRHNPGHYEMLFELGRIALEDRRDPARARNIWELALRRFQDQHAAAPASDRFVHAQILGHLARLEEQQQNYATALDYLRQLQAVSPSKEAIKRWIEEVQAKLNR